MTKITSNPVTEVKVKLIGENANAYYIIGKVSQALRDAGYTERFVRHYQRKAMAGGYKNLLKTTGGNMLKCNNPITGQIKGHRVNFPIWLCS